MKKMILTITLLTFAVSLNACGGDYFDDGSRAFMLTRLVRDGDVGKAQRLLESSNVATHMRFKSGNNGPFKSMVGHALELGWLGR